MPLLHSFFAIAAGFGAMAFLTAITTLLTRWLVPSWTKSPPSRAARIFNLIASCLYAALGGRVTTLLAPANPLIHALILAIVILLVSTIAAAEFRGQALGYYPLALATLPSAATLGAAILTVLYR
jgi:hypothetical protein